MNTPQVDAISDDEVKQANSASVKAMAYGSLNTQSPHYELYRVSRGWPYYRSGQLVKAQPQFKAQKIYCQDTGSKVSPAYYTDAANGQIKYPTKTV